MTPDAMHRLGYVYQALGQPTRATDTFLKLRSQFPQSSAAAEAAVPLAKAYAAQGEEKFPEAAGLLLSITDGDPILSPESPAVRQAMWELGQLYYRMGRYDEALARLEEYASRYETGDHAGQLTFLKADCYRLAAAQLQFEQRRPGDPLEPGYAQIASAATDSPQPVTDDKARRYLQQARSLYDQALEIYRLATAANSLDKAYERMAYFYRADCLFDLGQYEEAIKQYDAAAFRYQEEPASVAAYVQIVNAYNALGRPQDAEAANARALWLLKRIPAEAFKGSELLMSRQALEQWLRGITK